MASWREKYEYGPAKDSTKSCHTCSAFKDGKCGMFNDDEVEADHTCTEWSKTWSRESAWHHFSPKENRESILRDGLKPNAQREQPYIFVTNDPEPMRGNEDIFDEWLIDGDLEGVVPDPTGDAQTYDAPGWHAYPGAVSPAKLHLATVSVIPVRTTGFFRRAADDLLSHFDEQQGLGQPIYVALKKPQTLELRGGKIPVPGAQPFDVSSEGVPLYSVMDLGWNPATQERETAHPELAQSAPEHRGVYVDVPTNKHAEVRDWDPNLEWAYVHSPLNYPDGSDARYHPHAAAGWVPFSALRKIDRPRSPFRRRRR